MLFCQSLGRRSESRKSELFFYRKQGMIKFGNQSGLIGPNKITECLDMNLHNCLPGSYSWVHTSESLCTPQLFTLLAGFYPLCLFSPTRRSNHRRIPQAQCCSPLAPETACLCHSVFSLLCKTCAGKHNAANLQSFLFHREWADRSLLLGGTPTAYLFLLCALT